MPRVRSDQRVVCLIHQCECEVSHAISDKERFRKSTLTDACSNFLFHTVFVASVVAGPKGAPSGFEYSGNHFVGIPHSICSGQGMSIAISAAE